LRVWNRFGVDIGVAEESIERPLRAKEQPACVPLFRLDAAQLALQPMKRIAVAARRQQACTEPGEDRHAGHYKVLSMRLRSLARRVAGRPNEPERRRPDGLEAAREGIASLAAAETPVVAGPWLAEVGYELLYWIPFLRWAVQTEPDLRERLVVVSRGGVQCWYQGIAGSYVELYDAFTPDQLEAIRERGATASAGVRKQLTPAATDDEILGALSLPDGYELLHPSLMFGAFRQWLKRPATKPDRLPFRFAPLTVPAAPALPEEFAAVRFYYRASFPETPENRATVERIVEGLLEQGPVVSLDPRRRYDDHVDAAAPDGVVYLDELDRPSSNLAVQTAVVARARAFVGTYGGLSYLGPLVGTPAISLYSDASRFRRQHLDLARRVFAEPEYGAFVALDVDELPLLDLVAPQARGGRG
jgi:hypothetical protein